MKKLFLNFFIFTTITVLSAIVVIFSANVQNINYIKNRKDIIICLNTIESIGPERLRSDIENYFLTNDTIDNKYYKRNDEFIRNLYLKNNYYPLWHNFIKDTNKFSELLEYYSKAFYYGLKSKFYCTSLIIQEYTKSQSKLNYKNFSDVKLDLLLTSSYIDFCSHLEFGLIDINLVEDINTDNKKLKTINKYINLNKNDKLKNIKRIISNNKDLINLRKYLEQIIKKKNPVEITSFIHKIILNEKAKAIKEICSKLLEIKYLTIKQYNLLNKERLTKELSKYIKLFQINNEIKNTGEINDKTIKALNTPTKDIIDKIIANCEFSKWQKNHKLYNSTIYFKLNIPEKVLKFYDKDNISTDYIVCVGKRNEGDSGLITQTPILESEITKFTIYPKWYIPITIFTEEILDKAILDSSYLNKKHITIENYLTLEESSLEDYVNSEEKSHYIYIQDTEEVKTLGEYKIFFPNMSNIYIHGTQEQSYFNNISRTVTHGCIRVLNPKIIINKIIKNNISEENKKMLLTLQKSNEWLETEFKLSTPIPIIMTYQTININNKLIIKNLKDIYGYEKIFIDIYNNY